MMHFFQTNSNSVKSSEGRVMCSREWVSIFEACTCHQFFDETLPVGVADPLLDIDALVRDSSLTEDVRICHQVLRENWSKRS